MTLTKLLPNGFLNLRSDLWAAERLLTFGTDAVEAGNHPRFYSRTFRFGKNHGQFASWASRTAGAIDALLL
jgi:hypothetical protein